MLMKQPEASGPSRVWIYRVDPRQIHYLQFILEAYDGVATLTTVDAREGRVQVAVPPGGEANARSLMEALECELGRGRLKREEDWR
jgi:Domain of unknown function (DUF4911)